MQVLGIDKLFLNHLCDGELQTILANLDGEFLNHLCDGELNRY